MSSYDLYLLKGKALITLSVAFILFSIGINYSKIGVINDNYDITYQYINIKDMASANVKVKKISMGMRDSGQNTNKELIPLALEKVNNSMSSVEENRRIWYLPCEMGEISNFLSYSHFAVDITSPRGVNEAIFPIANGVVSDIYTDRAGAKIVTVNHNINGLKYTSQYVHLSSYAPDIYVGRKVTINDYLGYMGTTGNSTGVHLHLALVDCSLHEEGGECVDIGDFFTKGRRSISNGFKGIYSVMDVPTSWGSR